MGDQKMEQISSFKIAAGMLGIAALVKISVFALAVAMFGLATSAQAGGLDQFCTTASANRTIADISSTSTKTRVRYASQGG